LERRPPAGIAGGDERGAPQERRRWTDPRPGRLPPRHPPATCFFEAPPCRVGGTGPARMSTPGHENRRFAEPAASRLPRRSGRTLVFVSPSPGDRAPPLTLGADLCGARATHPRRKNRTGRFVYPRPRLRAAAGSQEPPRPGEVEARRPWTAGLRPASPRWEGTRSVGTAALGPPASERRPPAGIRDREAVEDRRPWSAGLRPA